MDHYAVFGDPIAHSRSPSIHALFARECADAIDYGRLRVPPGQLALALAAFQAGGGRGLNITLPHKEAAFALADVASERARRAGAANTLWFEGTAVHADNTDGIGLMRDLGDNLGIPLAGRRVLLLGAGGAARGVLAPLLAARPALLHVANRTATRAARLAEEFADLGALSASSLQALPGEPPFDVLINATSAGLAGDEAGPALPPAIVHTGSAAYDMMYGARPSAFMAWCRARGLSVVHDGLGMLVEQAAESYRIWRGHRPATAPVIATLRAALGVGESA